MGLSETRKQGNEDSVKEELYYLYYSPNTSIIQVIKSIRMRWAGHVVRMVIREVGRRVWLGELMERDIMEELGVDGSKNYSGVWRSRIGFMDWIDLAQDRKS